MWPNSALTNYRPRLQLTVSMKKKWTVAVDDTRGQDVRTNPSLRSKWGIPLFPQ